MPIFLLFLPSQTDIVRVLKDINLNVVSAEVDTIGRNAVDRFNITYHGEPLSGEQLWHSVWGE